MSINTNKPKIINSAVDTVFQITGLKLDNMSSFQLLLRNNTAHKTSPATNEPIRMELSVNTDQTITNSTNALLTSFIVDNYYVSANVTDLFEAKFENTSFVVKIISTEIITGFTNANTGVITFNRNVEKVYVAGDTIVTKGIVESAGSGTGSLNGKFKVLSVLGSTVTTTTNTTTFGVFVPSESLSPKASLFKTAEGFISGRRFDLPVAEEWAFVLLAGSTVADLLDTKELAITINTFDQVEVTLE